MMIDREKVNKRFADWKQYAIEDLDCVEELKLYEEDSDGREDAFYRDLSFGTGGLRGIIGAGTNRMNIYTVARASQGLADYITARYDKKDWRIAIAYDSRVKSDIFAQRAAEVFTANGIHVAILAN